MANIDTTQQTGDVYVRPYKTWTALLTQNGSNIPVAAILENTLGGDVTIQRFVNKTVQLTFPFNIALDKIFIMGQTVFTGSYTLSMPLTGFDSTISGTVIFYANHVDNIVTDGIAIDVYDASNVQVDLSTMVDRLPIEIRVYP